MELLELYLSPLDDKTKFKVIVTQSPAGEGETESSLPFIDAQGKDWRATIIRTLEISSFSAESFSTEERDWMVAAGVLGSDRSSFHYDYLLNIGKALYKSLFPKGSRVEERLKESIRLAESKSSKLVVRLKLEEDAVKKTRLADYPWELLYEGGFLCHRQVEFSRYIAYGAVPPSLPTADKLNVLLVSSAAFDLELDLKPFSRKEQKSIRKGLETARGRGDISLEELEEPTLAKLGTYLTERPGDRAPHVLHFDGHGLFAKGCTKCRAINKGTKRQRCRKCDAELPPPRGYLVFEDKEGNPDYVSAEELGTLLHQSGLSDGSGQIGGVRLVVLSACQSGMAIVGESVFNGAAQNLIAHRLPAVVAMQYSVGVDSASKFAERFYRSLGQKNSLAMAVSRGREAMGVEGNQWYRPVLYLRWQDNEGGQLFGSATASQSIPQNLPRSGVTKFVGREEDLKTLHQQLQEKEPVVISSIAGMGGVGKTELALQYAWSNWQQGTYPGGVCWLRVRDSNLVEQLLDFSKSSLNLKLPDDCKTDRQKVDYCWQNWRLVGNVLIIFDDVVDYDDIANILPPTESRFKVLITTRKKLLADSFQQLELEVLEEKATLGLLMAFLDENDTRIQQERRKARMLCADLGFLPLGVELVGRYLKRKPDLSFAEIREQLDLKHRALQKKDSRGETSKDMTAKRGVEAAFELTWQELSPAAMEVASFLSMLALGSISWELIEKCFPNLEQQKLEDIRDDFLMDLHIIRREKKGVYRIYHELIWQFLQLKLVESAGTDLPVVFTEKFAIIVENGPGWATKILQQEMLNWDFRQKDSQLSALTIGKQIRVAIQAWSLGINPLSKLVIPLKEDGSLPILGAGIVEQQYEIFNRELQKNLPSYSQMARHFDSFKSKRNRLGFLMGWYFGDCSGEDVVILPPEVTQAFANYNSFDSPAVNRLFQEDWNDFKFVPYQTQASWIWDTTFEIITKNLSELLEKRSLPVPKSHLSLEAAWYAALYLTRRRNHYSQPNPHYSIPISLDEIEASLSKAKNSNYPAMIQYCLGELRIQVEKFRSQGEAYLSLPSTFRAFKESNFVSPQILLEYTADVYQKAVDAYQELVNSWFSYLVPELQLASILPAKIVGVVIPPKHKSDSASVSWSWVPLPQSSKNTVDFQLSNSALSIDDSRFPDLPKKTLHFQGLNQPIYPYIWSMGLSFGKSWLGSHPVTEMVYQWLWQDLKKIGWVKGELERSFSWR